MNDITTKPDFRRWTHPVIVGSGQRLVRDGSDTCGLRLLDRQAFNAEVVAPASQAARLDDELVPLLIEERRTEAVQSITSLAMAMLGVSSDRDWIAHADEDVAD